MHHAQEMQRKDDMAPMAAIVHGMPALTPSAPHQEHEHEHEHRRNLGTKVIENDTTVTDVEAQKPKKAKKEKKEKKPMSGPCRRALNVLYIFLGTIFCISYLVLSIFFLVHGSPRSDRYGKTQNPKRVWAIVLGSVMLGSPSVFCLMVTLYFYIRYGSEGAPK